MRGRLIALIGASFLAGPVQAATPAQMAAAAPGLPGPVRLIATRVSAPGTQTGGNHWLQSKTGHKAASNISQIGLAFANWYLSSIAAAENQQGAPATVQAYVSYNGVCAPITFRGSFTGVIPAGGTLFSDVVTLPFTIPAGATFYTYEHRVIPSAGAVSVTSQDSSYGDLYNASGASLPDLRCGQSSGAGGKSLPPVAIYGPGVNPSVIVLGDEIASGKQDAPNTDYQAGFTDPFISFPANTVALNLASPILQASDYQNNPAYVSQRNRLLNLASTVISGLGTYDLENGNAATTVENSLAYVYNLVPQNEKIIQTTIHNVPTSSDGFTTTANQSADIHAGVISTVNGAITSPASTPLAARLNDNFDIATLLTPSGKWALGRAAVTDGATTGTTNLASTNANFTASDTNCSISVTNALTTGTLYTTIASVAAPNATMAATSNNGTQSGETISFSIVGSTGNGYAPCQWGYRAAASAFSTSKIR